MSDDKFTYNDIESAAQAMQARILVTRRCKENVYEECNKFLSAASTLYGRHIRFTDSKTEILQAQLLSLELMKIVPELMDKVQKIIDSDLKID